MIKISIIGTGGVGVTLAQALAAKNYSVTFGSRDPKSEKSENLKNQNSHFNISTPNEAALQADVVFLATPWIGTKETVKSIANDLKGKILVDMTNPLGPGFHPTDGTTTSGGEIVQSLAPEAKVVKAFNTIGCKHYLDRF